MHDCPECGLAHDAAEVEPAIVPVPVDPGPNENDVKIAEIEAAASIEREKIWTEQRALDLEGEVERQRGEIAGMREVLDRLVPEEPAEPEPIVIPVPDPEPVAEAAPAPEAAPAEKHRAPAKKGIFS